MKIAPWAQAEMIPRIDFGYAVLAAGCASFSSSPARQDTSLGLAKFIRSFGRSMKREGLAVANSGESPPIHSVSGFSGDALIFH